MAASLVALISLPVGGNGGCREGGLDFCVDEWGGAVSDLRIKDHRFHCLERCTGTRSNQLEPCAGG